MGRSKHAAEKLLIRDLTPIPKIEDPASMSTSEAIIAMPHIPGNIPADTKTPHPTFPATHPEPSTPTTDSVPAVPEPTLRPSTSTPSEKRKRKPTKNWEEVCATRTILCERQVELSTETAPLHYQDADRVLHQVIRCLSDRSMTRWFDKIKGYIPAFVREFYATAKQSESRHAMKGKVRGKVVMVTPDLIAQFIGCRRPRPEEVSYPREGYVAPTGIDLAGLVCSDIEVYRAKRHFTQGMLKIEYALLNKIVHYNIYPRGAEKLPREEVIQLVYEMYAGRVIDFGFLIWQLIARFRLQTGTTSSLPFAFMITTMCIDAGVWPIARDTWTPPPLGPITYGTVMRSESQHSTRVRESVTASSSRPFVPAAGSFFDNSPPVTIPTSVEEPSIDIPTSSRRPTIRATRDTEPFAIDSVAIEILLRLERNFEEERTRRLEWEREETKRRSQWERDVMTHLFELRRER